MSWICPLCGFQNEKTSLGCTCGFQADETFLEQSAKLEITDVFRELEQMIEEHHLSMDAGTASSQLTSKDMKIKVSDEPVAEKQNIPADEIFIKEIDSWKVTFSKQDQCIYLCTPALQPFKLKLTLDDLQELSDFIYEKSGINKTTRKRWISGNEVSEFVGMVEKMIEVKKSKIKIEFSADELQGIADIINKKLQE